ncbi:MAG TPA: MFS transporter [Ktedonobacterales bacterium]
MWKWRNGNQQAKPAAGDLGGFTQRRIPVALCLTLFMLEFNLYTLANILGPVVRGLQTTVASIQMALVLLPVLAAITLPTARSLVGLYGRKKVFRLGLLLFAGGMGITVVSVNTSMMVLGFGVVAGLAAAPLITLPWMMMLEAYTGRRREFAFFALNASLVVGTLLGPLVGGLLATNINWRLAFLPQAVLALVILLLVREMPEMRKERTAPLDWAGVLVLLFGLIAILWGLGLGSEYGWWMARESPLLFGHLIRIVFGLSVVPFLLLVGVILLGVFVFHRWRHRATDNQQAGIQQMGMLGRRPFLVGATAHALYVVSTMGLTFTLFLYLQWALRLTPFATAITLLPFNLALIIVLLLTMRLSERAVPKYMVQAGLLGMIVGLVLLYLVLSPSVTRLELMPALIIIGLGAGFVVGQVPNLVLSLAQREERGESNALLVSFQDIGYGLGISLFGAILISTTASLVVSGVTQRVGLSLSPLRLQSLTNQFAQILHTFNPDQLNRVLAPLSPSVRQALEDVAPSAATEAMRLTVLCILGVVLLAFLISFLLPSKKVFRAELIED